MVKKNVFVFFQISFYCALVNVVIAKTVPPSEIEPLPDLYSLASAYSVNNVNYNASPNPQYSSNNFNNFNEPTPQPPNQIHGNYPNMDYQQNPPIQPKSIDELVQGNYSPTLKSNDIANELKNTLVSMKDNLGFMADTQRLLLNSFKVQQHQYNDIEEKLQLREHPAQRNVPYGGQPIYNAPASQPIQYSSIPPLPPLPYVLPTTQEHTVHHHKKHSHKKGLGKLLKKHKKGSNRGLGLFRRVSERERLERHATMTLAYIRNGVVNALWTALVVACVKLAPILLFGFKLMFRSVLPLTGLALFGTNRGLFPKHLKDDRDDDDDVQIDDDEDDDDELDDEDRDISEEDEEKEKTNKY